MIWSFYLLAYSLTMPSRKTQCYIECQIFYSLIFGVGFMGFEPTFLFLFFFFTAKVSAYQFYDGEHQLLTLI